MTGTIDLYLSVPCSSPVMLDLDNLDAIQDGVQLQAQLQGGLVGALLSLSSILYTLAILEHFNKKKAQDLPSDIDLCR
jgi:hypothetical protein